MVKPRVLTLLLVVTVLLALSLSQGFVKGREMQVTRKELRHDGRLLPEEMAATVMDYGGPKANTNTRGGMLPPDPEEPSSPPAH